MWEGKGVWQGGEKLRMAKDAFEAAFVDVTLGEV
jgi:hypothetical protein